MQRNGHLKDRILRLSTKLNWSHYQKWSKGSNHLSKNPQAYMMCVFRDKIKFRVYESDMAITDFNTIHRNFVWFAHEIVHVSILSNCAGPEWPKWGNDSISDPLSLIWADVDETGVVCHSYSHLMSDIRELELLKADRSGLGYGEMMTHQLVLKCTANCNDWHAPFTLCDDFVFFNDSSTHHPSVTLFFKNEEDYLEALLLVNADA